MDPQLIQLSCPCSFEHFRVGITLRCTKLMLYVALYKRFQTSLAVLTMPYLHTNPFYASNFIITTRCHTVPQFNNSAINSMLVCSQKSTCVCVCSSIWPATRLATLCFVFILCFCLCCVMFHHKFGIVFVFLQFCLTIFSRFPPFCSYHIHIFAAVVVSTLKLQTCSRCWRRCRSH